MKIREDNVVRNKAVYLALGVLPDGSRDILGLWIENTKGAKFWMKVFNDLLTRGVADILIAVTDGLKGMPEALAATYPATTLQTCIVRFVTVWTMPVGRSARRSGLSIPRSMPKALKPRWLTLKPAPLGSEIPHRGGRLAPGLEQRDSVLRVPAGSTPGDLHHQCHRECDARLRKIIKTRGHFPSDEAATKLNWLALRNITANWGRGVFSWKPAMNQFAILYQDRFTRARA